MEQMGEQKGRKKQLSKVYAMKDRHIKDKIKITDFHKEIDLIQACITRMADNSFKLKELYVSLISIALTVMMSQKCELLFVGMFLLGVTVVFWGLDAFFLKMETLYRWKYEWVIEKRSAGEREYLYNLNPYNKNMWLDINGKNECFMRFVFSKTLIPLYGIVIGISIILLLTAIVTY